MDQATTRTDEKEVKASKSFSESEVSPKSFKASAKGMGNSKCEYNLSPKRSEVSDSFQLCDAAIISSANEADEGTAEGARWYELLKTRIGLDATKKEWIKAHPELVYKNKSELMLKLANELCLAKNTKYNRKNDRVDNEKENNKYARFDKKSIFALFTVANDLIEQSDRKRFVHVVCKKDKVQLLKMILLQDTKQKARMRLYLQYPWEGYFTGYTKLIDLLQYTIDKRCSSQIILCIAKKIYGTLHNIYNGTEYLEQFRVRKMETMLNQPSPLMKECLKKAAKFDYKSVVLVMLGGDIYHCFRLMTYKTFNKKTEFLEAYNMIKETVGDVISSWVQNVELKSFKDNVQRLINQGIKTDISKMSKSYLVDELHLLGMEDARIRDFTKKDLIKMFVKEVDQDVAGNIMLRKTVVGAFISVVCFEYQDIVMEDKDQDCFTFEMPLSYKKKKRNRCAKLIDKINNGKPVEDIVLYYIKLLNTRSHISYGSFFREVLANIVNDKEKLSKLRAVCTAICRKPMKELLKGVEVNEEVMNVLKFFGVDKDTLVLENSDQSVTTVLEKSDVLSSIPTNISLSQTEDPANSSSISEMVTSNIFSTSNIASSPQSIANATQTCNHFPLTPCGLQKVSITGPVNQDTKVTFQDKFIIDAELEKVLVTMPSSSSLPAAPKRRHSESELSSSSREDMGKENGGKLGVKSLKKSGKK